MSGRTACATLVLLAGLLAGARAQQSATPARDQQKPVKGTAVIKGQVVDGVEIVFSRKWREISGTVTDDRGNTLTDTWLVLFPADESQWTPESRYVRATRPGVKGTYRFQRILPHDAYLLATVPDVEQGQWQDPEFLRSVRDRAVRVSVADGETKVQNLRVGSAPQ